MIEQVRGLSFVAYTYEGGEPLRFTVTFPYLKREHVRVLVGDPQSPRVVTPQWIDTHTVEIPDQAPHLTAPYSVLLRRFTPITESAIDFQDGAKLPAKQLNVAVKQLLFAQQEIREFGLDGNGLPGVGIPGGGPGNLPDIQTIIDQVIQSPAFQILQQHIPLIDANAELVMEEILRSNEYFDRHRDHGDKISTAYTRIDLVESETEVIAEQYTELFARVITGEQDVAAQFLQVNTAIANEREARVSSMTDLHAQITHETGVTVAQHVNAVEVRVTATEASVQAVEGALANVGDALAATNTRLDLTADASGANTQWRQLFAAQFGPGGATGTSVAAAVKNEIGTRATPAEAQAIANTTVSAFANGTFAALQQSYNAYVNANDGRWESTWALRINGGDINNPVIAGIALSANPSGSDFVVMADRFAIVTPSGTGSTYGARKFPFVVGTVGGVSTVGITGQLLVDGSVTANKITANTLSAITANAGTINGGTFKTHTLNAQGEVINALEFRAEMSNLGNWPLWIGAGVKNENNAVMWVDRDGNAGFKGRVSAPNIIGQFQQATSVNWTGGTSVPADSWTQVHTFSLGTPLGVGEEHAPVVTISVMHDPAEGVEYSLEYLNGSVWEQIAYQGTQTFQFAPTVQIGQAGGHSHTFSVTGTTNSDGNHSHSVSGGGNTGLAGSHSHSFNTSASSGLDGAHSHTATVFPSPVRVVTRGATLAGAVPPRAAATQFRVLVASKSATVVRSIRGFTFGIR